MSRLITEQMQQFAREGYLVVEGVLDPTRDFAPIMAEYDDVLDGLARELYADGAIASLYDDLPFPARLSRICAETGRVYSQHFDFSLPQNGVEPDTPIFTGPAMFRLLTNPALLDLVESVIGPEIFSCPVQHTRTKLPRWALGGDAGNGLVGKIPWHQDIGVLMPEADESTILTVWIPMNAATVENGCMQVIPRSHRVGKLFDHCPGGPGGLAIPDAILPPGDPVVLPMQPGSVLLMTQSTVHSSLDNVTEDQVRISFDLRYQPTGQPTGRPAFAPAGFVARSKAHPETELRDPSIWRRNWLAVRDELAAQENPAFNRWDANAPVCA
jgi:phytanoyl-CoA hydroxylase